MVVEEFIGETLCAVTAITALVGTRIVHGLRLPTEGGWVMPAINYYALPGTRKGVSVTTFSINCRAREIDDARKISRLVLDTFVGIDGMGKYGGTTTFSAYRIFLTADHQVIPEIGGYNSPVDITFVY
jgi:hypothetical protein